MIVASLLLILVAVTLLVLGLTGGSSGFLIGSIVASLLAAVALVIGARQAAGARRAAGSDPAAPTAESDSAADFPAADFPAAGFPAESAGPAGPAGAVFAAEPEFAAAADARRNRPDDSLPADEAFAADSTSPDRRDTVQFAPAAEHAQGDLSADEARAAGRRDAEEAAPDYEHASSVIGGARTDNPDEHAWRRDPAAPEPEMADEFDEPDADDPDDEPLPQRVEPADAVRIARLDAEVLVVDGRPRYHLSDCPHLVGRLAEPVPVNEAVELGFSPCGLCRPVSRLVAASAHR